MAFNRTSSERRNPRQPVSGSAAGTMRLVAGVDGAAYYLLVVAERLQTLEERNAFLEGELTALREAVEGSNPEP